jgi:S-layer homology domain
MKYIAATVAAALGFALVAPVAFAQPFGDVPTNHWAYDAIAHLAAKGIIEGYPDRTFKGDRAMTRYEMAMVVARLLARIESIQVPAAPTAPSPAPTPGVPPITRVDVETIQRLVNEFRGELAALGVRTNAIEEELNALKARVGNVKFGGALRFREDEARVGTGGAIAGNGNPNTHSTDSSNSTAFPLSREVFKLTFDGSVASNVHLIGAMATCFVTTLVPSGNCINYFPFNSSGNATLGNVDSLFFDWTGAFGLPLEFWLGRWGCTQVGACYATQFGPFGLLMNTTGDTWEDSTGNSGNNLADGISAKLAWPSLWDLKFQAALIRVRGLTAAATYFAGEDAYGLDANAQIISGLRVGAYYAGSTYNGGFSAISGTHAYGPAGSVNPVTAKCPVFGTAGISCDAQGNGAGAYIMYDFSPAIHFDGEYAQWNDLSATAGSDTGYQVNIHWDLGALTGLGHNFSLDTGYLNFGQNFYPPYGAAEADIAMADAIYPGNAQGETVAASYDLTPTTTLYGLLFTGNNVSNSQSLSEYEAGVTLRFAPGAKITFKIRDLKIAGIDQFTLYRAQMDYGF